MGQRSLSILFSFKNNICMYAAIKKCQKELASIERIVKSYPTIQYLVWSKKFEPNNS